MAHGNDPSPPASLTAIGEGAAVRPRHRRLDDRQLDPQQLGQPRPHGRTVRRALSAGRRLRQTAGVTSHDPGPRQLANLRAPDILSRISERSILVQPLGAIEQHGPHLPLSTDLVIADAVAGAAVERAGETLDVWLLPSLAYTKSDEHAWSPGTVWLSSTTMLAVLDDIGRCVATTAARRLVWFNGHGGNSALLGIANREVRRNHGLMTFLAHPSLPPDQGGDSTAGEQGFGIHGGADETSLMLHLAPELVDLDAADATGA